MTYLVAYVKFPGAKKDYPTDCVRTDIEERDTVIVRRRDGVLRPAIVTRVEFLDWDCGATLVCRASEAEFTAEGIKIPVGAPKVIGLSTLEAFRDHLVKRAWIPLRTKNNVHKVVLTHCNGEEIANIYLRRRGVDIQILPELYIYPPAQFSYVDCSISDGCLVRHHLAKTTFNLYEGVSRFAEAFERGEGEYTRFFNPVGSRDRKTSDLPSSCLAADASFDAMLYDALGGDGGSVYIGDGLYMGGDGGGYD